ncbi:MAG: PLDc N-terminal domain-containing protein [Bacteroidota bacterium]|nr:PLDc N-terminal domain-containing protein [Bacteroidota bacterium]
MKEFRNPVFDLGVLSVILFLAGIFILNSNQHYGYIVLFIATGMGVLFTLISVIELMRSKTLKGQKKVLWLVIVFLVPLLGSFMYYIFSRSNEKSTIE